MRLACLVVTVLTACVQSQSTVCTDDRVCPGDKVCDEMHGLCVDQGQLDACTARDQFAACDAVAMGRCYDGVCLGGGCGNSIVDPADPRLAGDTDERCDDGNRNAGDGCSADCKSEETCGNGVVDLINSETCDDENGLSHDGCSSNCTLEPARWVALPGLGAREQHAMAFDSYRGRVVLFGGYVAGSSPLTYLAGTYEHDGQRWHPVAPLVEPSPRRAPAMAYDAKRHVVVLFGGSDGASLGDTWEWNGVAWRLIETLTAPSPRQQSAMVFDAANDRVLLMGGLNNNLTLSDTWAWDGQTWISLVQNGPFARVGHAMVYDPVRNVTVLFGGSEQTVSYDTWEFDGATWTRKATTSGLTHSFELAAAFDPVQNMPLLLEQDVGAWRWNGSTWTKGTEPWIGGTWTAATTSTGNVVADPVRQRMVALGNNGDTFIYDGTAWTREASSASDGPPPMFAFGLARDPSRRRVVLYGGTSPPTTANAPLDPLSTTWAWDGTWKNLGDVGGSAGARFWPGFVFDEARDTYVVFGGADSNTSEVSTTFSSPDAVTWTAEATPAGLAARVAPVMVYDPARANVVLFGGVHHVTTNTEDDYADTWIWNGTWQQVTPAHAPSKRDRASAAYDPIRQRVVLFGGVQYNLGKRFGDTWEWDGTDWQEMMPPASPPPRMGGGLAWDATRQRLVLMGGFDASGGARDDAWEWDGTTWKQLLTAQRPGIRTDHGMFTAFDGGGVVAMRGALQMNTSWNTAVDGPIAQLHRDSETPEEACIDGFDVDLDGAAGCTDLDCWTACTPSCPPATSCSMTAPRCGDNACNATVEDCASCPGDCGGC